MNYSHLCLSFFILFNIYNITLAKCNNLISNPFLSKTTMNELNAQCTCGVFLEGQLSVNKEVLPGQNPAFSKDMDVPIYPCGIFGSKQCMKKCMNMVLKYLPSIGPTMCASIGRISSGEKAHLFTKTCGNVWQDTGFSAGKKFCCSNGLEVECRGNGLGKESGLIGVFDTFLKSKSLPDLFFDMADRTTNLAVNILKLANR